MVPLMMVMAGMVALPPIAAAAAPPRCAASAGDEAAATSLAVACGGPVAVEASRTEYSQVLALPDGRMRFETAVVPQRARVGDRWADVDLRLASGADGLLRPRVSVADVAFSAGGDSPLITLRRGGATLTMSWPARLPEPVIDGDSATYRAVAPDVDLVVRATSTGFTHVLVVHSALGAAQEVTRSPRVRLGGDTRVAVGADGSLRASAGGRTLALAEPAVMWDSRTGATAVAGRTQSVSSARSAGDAARSARVRTRLVGGDLVLEPAAELLAPGRATFPLYIDPAWSVAKTKWAYATNNGSSNTDYTVARVGLNPDSGVLYRSIFEFSTTANGVSLKDKHIESAYVQMKVDHTWSCGNTWNHMYQTPVINATMRATWSTMKLSSWMSSAESHANEAGGCGEIQPDMTVNFDGASVTSKVQQAATSGWTTLTVGFCACNSAGEYETSQDRWKKYLPGNAKLFVDYDTVPTAPTALMAAGVACPASGVLTVGTLNPTFAAQFNDADGQSLTGAFEWIEVPAAGLGAVTDTSPTRLTPPPPKTGVTANTSATSNAVAITGGKTYAFRAKATDPAPYSMTGPWSAWCQFAADTTAPPAPTILADEVAGPGQQMTFTFRTGTTDVTKFRYGWTSSPATEVAATTVMQFKQSSKVVVVVPSYGSNTLWVRSVDATNNPGNLGSYTFVVKRPAPPVARWGLETYPGVDGTAALADQQPGVGAQLLTTTQQQASTSAAFVTVASLTSLGTSTAYMQGDSRESLAVSAVSSSSADTFAAVGGDSGGGLRLGMQAGRTYTVSGWIYVPAATGLTPVDQRGLRIVAFTKVSAYQETRSAAATAVDTWQRLSVTFTVPTGATEAFIRLYNGFAASKTVYWDNLSLTGATATALTVSSGVTWPADVRLLGGQVTAFNGSSSVLSTPDPVFDPTKSFSVAAWVKLGATGDPLPTSNKAAVTQDGALNNPFVLGYNGGHGKWAFWMHTTDDATTRETGVALSSVPVVMGAWTHLAASYDAATGQTRLFVNGQAPATGVVTNYAAWPNRKAVSVGREFFGGNGYGFWPGQLADVQIFDRTLLSQDFTGMRAADPMSGGFNEPGILTPTRVGDWSFEAMAGCYVPDRENSCEAPDATRWDRWMALSLGAEQGNGHSEDSAIGVAFDGDLNGTATTEYGRTAIKTGLAGPDAEGEYTTLWQNKPVLRTDQSFTVSAWVKLDRTDTYQTVVAQDGVVNSGFMLYYAPDAAAPKWKMKVLGDAATPDNTGATFAETAASDVSDTWHHLVGVLDVQNRRLKLYVDGVLKADSAMHADWQPWQATGPLTVGRAYNTSNLLHGLIDDVQVFQGAMTDGAVADLYDIQS